MSVCSERLQEQKDILEDNKLTAVEGGSQSSSLWSLLGPMKDE